MRRLLLCHQGHVPFKWQNPGLFLGSVILNNQDLQTAEN
jgi:hypothetical protein